MSAYRIRSLRPSAPALLGLAIALLGANAALVSAAMAQGQGKFVVTPIGEKTVDSLPDGDLYWHVEKFAAMDAAEAAAGEYGIVAEVEGEPWLFTLGAEEAEEHGGAEVAVIGPVARFDAPQYLLRINSALAPPGEKSSVHSHPGTEVLYVIAGEVSMRTVHGEEIGGSGDTMVGHGPDTVMEVTSVGEDDLRQVVMFVVDPSRPFSEPGRLD